MDYRIEWNLAGKMEVPADRYRGAQTQRSYQNFQIGTEKMSEEIVRAFGILKKAVALANHRLGKLDDERLGLISRVCDEVVVGKPDGHFPLVVWQTGSGIQSNMNVNEVVTNWGNELVGRKLLHPNDHANMSQNSNDTFPTAMHIVTVVALEDKLLPAIDGLVETFQRLEGENGDVVKSGRTHLQDTAPITLAQEISGWRTSLEKDRVMMKLALPGLRESALGGTAVGTGFNAPKGFDTAVAEAVSELMGKSFVTAPNKFHILTSEDELVFAHGTLKALVAGLMKIASDVCWLASGPRCGLGEIQIPENEPGSSIMSGKVDPAQCEAVTIVAVQAMVNDVVVGLTVSQGNFELNMFTPACIYNLLQFAQLLTDCIRSSSDHCAVDITANQEKCRHNLHNSLMLVIALDPCIGYDNAAKTAKKTHVEHISLREVCISLGFLTAERPDEVFHPEEMVWMGRRKEEKRIMDVSQESLKLYEEPWGKTEVVARRHIETRDNLSLLYTPSVVKPCREIVKDYEKSFTLTRRSNPVAVITDGSVVLGLGDIGPAASMPVMEGKRTLFKEFDGVDAFSICVDTKDVDKLMETIALIPRGFGGINLEDTTAPRCFEAERRLKGVCDIPVLHDDQHGTAIAVATALLSTARVTGKQMGQMKVVINGAGAAGITIGKLLIPMGFGNIVMCDINGIICEGDEGPNAEQEEISHIPNRNHEHGALVDALRRTDAFVGVSRPNLVTTEMVSIMKDGIVFAMANPTPEVMPDGAKRGGTAVVGTGCGDFPNQINNVTVFPGIFKGALAVRAQEITEGMKIRAVRALATLVTGEQFSADYISPSVLDKSAVDIVAHAVAQEAREQSIARV